MKKLILTLAVLLPTLSFASTVVKTFDGGVARCKEGADIGSRAYRLKLLSETHSETHKKISLSVSMFACLKTDEGLRLVPISLNSAVARPYINASNELDSLSTELSDTRLFAFTEKAQVVGDIVLKENAEGKMLATLSVPHNLNTNQVILNLKSVQTIKGTNGNVLDRSNVIASTFLLNLN